MRQTMTPFGSLRRWLDQRIAKKSQPGFGELVVFGSNDRFKLINHGDGAISVIIPKMTVQVRSPR